MAKTNIGDLTREELEDVMSQWDEPRYRAAQIFFWLYEKAQTDFEAISNLSLELRERLKERFYIGLPAIAEKAVSADGTEKYLVEFADGNYAETVVIPAQRRTTICFSTQVGCRYACPFCASGTKGFVRNLSPAEIVGQVKLARREFRRPVGNCVAMGIGEPLDNYDNLARAIAILNDTRGMGIGARRITVSTCGVVPGILKMAEMGLQVNLSVSLHAARDELRNTLVPMNRKYQLAALVSACRRYAEKTGRMITLEYIILRGVNDGDRDALDLAALARALRAKVNLIPYSPVTVSGFEPATRDETRLFLAKLASKKIKVTLRESKGLDIRAACGQLAGKAKA